MPGTLDAKSPSVAVQSAAAAPTVAARSNATPKVITAKKLVALIKEIDPAIIADELLNHAAKSEWNKVMEIVKHYPQMAVVTSILLIEAETGNTVWHYLIAANQAEILEQLIEHCSQSTRTKLWSQKNCAGLCPIDMLSGQGVAQNVIAKIYFYDYYTLSQGHNGNTGYLYANEYCPITSALAPYLISHISNISDWTYGDFHTYYVEGHSLSSILVAVCKYNFLDPLNGGKRPSLYSAALEKQCGASLTIMLYYSKNFAEKLAASHAADHGGVLALVTRSRSKIPDEKLAKMALDLYLSANIDAVKKAKINLLVNILKQIIKIKHGARTADDEAGNQRNDIVMLINSLMQAGVVLVAADIVEVRESLLKQNELEAFVFFTAAVSEIKAFTPMTNDAGDIEVLAKLARLYTQATSAKDAKAAGNVPQVNKRRIIRLLTDHMSNMQLDVAKVNPINLHDINYAAQVMLSETEGGYAIIFRSLYIALFKLNIFKDQDEIVKAFYCIKNPEIKKIFIQYHSLHCKDPNIFIMWLATQKNWQGLGCIHTNSIINAATLRTVVNAMIADRDVNNAKHQIDALYLLCGIYKDSTEQFEKILQEVINAGQFVLARAMFIYGAHLITKPQALIAQFFKQQDAAVVPVKTEKHSNADVKSVPKPAGAEQYVLFPKSGGGFVKMPMGYSGGSGADSKAEAKTVVVASKLDYDAVEMCDMCYKEVREEEAIGHVREFESALLEKLIDGEQSLAALRTRILATDKLALLRDRRPPGALHTKVANFFSPGQPVMAFGTDKYRDKPISGTGRKILTKAQKRAKELLDKEIESLSAVVSKIPRVYHFFVRSEEELDISFLTRIDELELTAAVLLADNKPDAIIAVKKFIQQLKFIPADFILPALKAAVLDKAKQWVKDINNEGQLILSFSYEPYYKIINALEAAQNGSAILGAIQALENFYTDNFITMKYLKPLKDFCKNIGKHFDLTGVVPKEPQDDERHNKVQHFGLG